MKVPYRLLKFLSDEEIRRIDDGALKILREVGIRVMSSRMRKSLADYGAKVEEQEGVVKLSEEVVRRALAHSPSEVVLRGRAGEVLRIGGENYYHYGCVQLPFTIDYETHKLRDFRFKDFTDHIKIVDSLPGFSGISGFPNSNFSDIPPELAPVKAAEACFSLSTKPCTIAINNLPLTRMWLDMAEIAVGGRGLSEVPTILVAVSTTSPLQIEADSAESLFEIIERGVPVLSLPCPMAGATSPYSLAGTLVMHTAESLFIIVTCQAIDSGHPVIYGGVPSTMDMRTGGVSYGNPEFSILFVGMAQLAHHFGLPVYAPIACTDAKQPDMQAGFEKMMAFLLARLGGLNLSQCSGITATGMGVVAEQIVIEHEIMRSVEHIVRGISVDERTLGLAAIPRVGIGKDFLMDEDTLELLGSEEHFENRVADRSVLGAPAKGIYEKAHQVAHQLITEHQSRVPDKIVDELKSYVEKNG